MYIGFFILTSRFQVKMIYALRKIYLLMKFFIIFNHIFAPLFYFLTKKTYNTCWIIFD